MKKILLVDDDEEILNYLAGELSDLYRVSTAKNGVEAYQCYRNENDFEILITDIYMPEMDGIELIKKIVKHSPKAKIIAMSGYQDKILQGALRSGASEIIRKPFDIKELKEAVSNLKF